MPVAELRGRPSFGICLQLIGLDTPGVPGVVEEERYGKLHRFDIAYIHDPYLPRFIGPGQMHLFPYARERVRVDPFIISWSSHVIEVVIDAVAAFTRFFIQSRQLADIAPVVVAKQ